MTLLDKEMSCCSLQYCSVTNHSKTQWLRTTICCFLLQFCGLTRISCIILTWHLWWSCRQRVARAGVIRRLIGLDTQEGCFPHLSVHHGPPPGVGESRAEDHGVAWTSYLKAQGTQTRKQKIPGVLMSGSKLARHHFHQIPLFKTVTSQPSVRGSGKIDSSSPGAWPPHTGEKELMADIFPDKLPPNRKREFFRTNEILSASTALRETHSLLLVSGPVTKQQSKIWANIIV